MIYIQQLRERYQLTIGYLGTIVIGIGIALLIPLLIVPIYKGEVEQIKYFLIPSVFSIVLGYIIRKANLDKEATLTLHEGGVIVVFAWFITIIISATPFILSGQLNFTQAMFESVSGWTTTGLSVVDVTKTPNTFLLWRSIMQFLGGAGLAVVMLSAIIGPHGLGLYNAEGRSDKLLPDVAKSTKLIMTIYLSYIVAGIVLYIIAGMNWFDAINHAIAALSTGGFSTKVDSIGEFNSVAIELITIVLMFLGTINFAAHFLLLKGEIKRFFKIGEIRFMFFILSLAIPITIVIALLGIYNTLGKTIRVGVFELVSALSTTGFSTVGYEGWPSFAIFIMIALMIIGGGAGSTAGGLKQYRVYIMLKSLIWNLKGYLVPRNTVRQEYVIRPEGKYYVPKKHIVEITAFATIYFIVYVIGVLIMLAYGFPLQESMFEFASTLGTVGLSVGITSPDTPVLILWSQILGMMLGRLEFFVFFFAGVKIIRDTKLMATSFKR
ncbi:TrkH family potassium uptake protein [Alkaliphilus peptidifermentans]|uniref:Trk system potassium uptake protein TrkH n=1 Tax=Alkaliphilus peptidifermentans DSM 18978 TaxID=1120976 RepID=A0A1G5CKY8_9FIRM|nr:TrkH family potassium uptake protein [Alkaliphilus peptidifermentans]SCY03004.1 trk system potassium uptake protein TrkH [Alkaliphilus peptidifermentans DSM 18978]